METMVEHPADGAQYGLVREYCNEAEARILIAHSLADAKRIKAVWCNRFMRQCESELLVNAASLYLDEIIARQWKESRE